MSGQLPHKLPPAAAKIGEALQRKQDQISPTEVAQPICQLRALVSAMDGPIHQVQKKGVIGRKEWTSSLLALHKPFAGLVGALSDLHDEVYFDEVASVFAQAEKDGVLSPEEFRQSGYHLGISVEERGNRLQQAVIRCGRELEAFRESSSPLGVLIKRVAEDCYSRILSDLSRLRILRICEHETCRKPLYPSIPEKRFCSLATEGRDCSSKARSKRHYHSQKKTAR